MESRSSRKTEGALMETTKWERRFFTAAGILVLILLANFAVGFSILTWKLVLR
jgi:hypothetical protein